MGYTIFGIAHQVTFNYDRLLTYGRRDRPVPAAAKKNARASIINEREDYEALSTSIRNLNVNHF
ncbi:MAG: hypothetical protein MUD14_27885 [Hydrococcus sp. Prado102]|nr:hypothetical protein [Hydrococcus sp. Prado102]